LAKPQLENLLKTMECSEHILALKTVLFSLDSHAQKVFDEQLALEHAKNQKQREALEMMLRSLQIGFFRNAELGLRTFLLPYHHLIAVPGQFDSF
jgi:hypothetical protein